MASMLRRMVQLMRNAGSGAATGGQGSFGAGLLGVGGCDAGGGDIPLTFASDGVARSPMRALPGNSPGEAPPLKRCKSVLLSPSPRSGPRKRTTTNL